MEVGEVEEEREGVTKVDEVEEIGKEEKEEGIREGGKWE